MFAFWIAAAALSAAVGWLILRGSREATRRVSDDDPTIAVHRRQLDEIEDLAARGLLPEGEVRAARAEAGRRLLAAADTAVAEPSASGRRLAFAAALVAPLLALGAYLLVGAPDQRDQPYAARLAEWRSGDLETLDMPRLAAILRAITVERPNDAEAYYKLASVELGQGDAIAAGTALRRAVRIAPERADLWALLGESFVVQADGRVDGDARTAFSEALKRDPASVSARYFLSRADIQDGKVAEGLAGWRSLLAALPSASASDQAVRAALTAEIAAVQKAGALPTVTPAPAPQPGLPDDAAIRGMVEGLAARLETQPDDAEGWVRLVRAWTVLGETGKRDAARARARQIFKDNPQVLQALDQAAEAPR